MISEIAKQIQQSIKTKEAILSSNLCLETIKSITDIITEHYRHGNSVLLCGNGGSAADAQHIAAEFVARFKLERKGLPALALNTNTSSLTAIGNDYDYSRIFERQVEAFGREGDILVAISTSGNSESIRKAILKAKENGMITIALLGKDGGVCKDYADIVFIVPSDDTPRIQEAHIMVGHIICDIVEKALFDGEDYE